MEINILKQEKYRMEIEIVGEDHTLCNALRKELWKDKNVKAAAYKIEHPLVSNPNLLVETKKETPKKAFTNASDSLKKTIKQIREQVNKVIK